ncbi:MAG: helix-turn-helix domain-containing protein [Bacteroidota bacterium]
MNKKLLSQTEVANIFGVSANTIKNWREDRLLSYVQVPGSSRKFYFPDEVDAFINKHKKEHRGGGNHLKRNKIKGEPRISSKSDEDWRID